MEYDLGKPFRDTGARRPRQLADARAVLVGGEADFHPSRERVWNGISDNVPSASESNFSAGP